MTSSHILISPESFNRIKAVIATGIKLRNSYQICYVNMEDVNVKPDCLYVIETEHGIDIGQTCKNPNCIIDNCNEVEKKGKLLREASHEDLILLPDIEAIEKNAYNVCKEKITKRHLDMKLISVRCLFDKTKIIFYFVAENRVDFRELVKDLATIFRTRIEMRQIGVRDKARMVGGFGICGRELCCVHLKEGFEPVSIRMAKEQNLNLNSLKISGMCGRLLCCLGHEYDTYRKLNERLPALEIDIKVGDMVYTVISVDVLNSKVRLKSGDHILDISGNDIRREGNVFFISSEVIQRQSDPVYKEVVEEDGDNN